MALPPDTALASDEFSACLKIAQAALYRLAQEGSQNVGPRRRCHRAAIDEWLSGRARVAAGSVPRC